MGDTKELNLRLHDTEESSGEFTKTSNENLQKLDDHDHSAGKGKQIKFSSLEIDSNIDFNGERVTNSKGISLRVDDTPVNNQVFRKADGNLYYKNASGVEVQVTDGSNVHNSGGGSGGSADLGANYNSPASLNYNRTNLASTNTNIVYEFFRDLSNLAYAGIKSAFLRLKSSGGNDVDLKANDTSSAYTVTLPASAPSSSLPVQMDSSGGLSTAQITNAQIQGMDASKLTGSSLPSRFIPSISLPKVPYDRESSRSMSSGDYSIGRSPSPGMSVDVPSAVGRKIVSVSLKLNNFNRFISQDTDLGGTENIYSFSPIQWDTSYDNKNILWRLWRSTSSSPSLSDGVTLASGTLSRLIATDDGTSNQSSRSTSLFEGSISACVLDNGTSGKYGLSFYAPERRSSTFTLNTSWEIDLYVYSNNSSDFRG